MQERESGMIELTEEQRRLMKEHPGEPIKLLDPVTGRSYLLTPADAPHTAGGPRTGVPAEQAAAAIPLGIRRAQEAFRRDLPRLLENRKLRGQWAAYHKDERVGIAPRMADLTRVCLGRGLAEDD